MPNGKATARAAALAEIGALPLTDREWLALLGMATMLRLGGASIEGLRLLLTPPQADGGGR